MKLKILLVDNEPKVLRGLEMVINRADKDWQIIGQCQDGFTALKLIRQLSPDLVITDIKIPNINGLELVEEAKKIFPEIQFIILSGYPDFKYAQQALKLGVTDYILKPTDYKDLLDSITELEKRKVNLASERQEEIALKNYKNDLVLSLREQALLELITNPDSKILETQVELPTKLYIFYHNYILIFIMLENFSLSSFDAFDENLKKLLQLKEAVKKIIYKKTGCLVDLNNGIYCCLLNITDENPAYIDETVKEIQAELQEKMQESITIGVSRVYNLPTQINIAFKECLTILRNRIFLEKNSIIQIDKVNQESNIENYPLELELKYLESLKFGDFQRSTSILKEIIQEMNRLSKGDLVKLKNLTAEFGVVVAKYLSDQGFTMILPNCTRESIHNQLKPLNQMEEIQEFLVENTKTITNYFHMYNKPGCRRIINEIMLYIKNNYFNEITLRQIANDYFMNESYLSDLFKRETGYPFTSFLTKIRMEKAKELLKQLDLRTYEVAEMVGYQNPKYFNKVFRKYTGMAPFDYRETVV